MAKSTLDKTSYTARLKTDYNQSFSKDLKDQFSLANILEVPRLEKIVINAGLGKAKDDKRILEVARNTITKITGQKPIDTLARKSIANFKLRENSKVGIKVTLRDERMYEFADRFINIVLPRLRDFHGVSPRSFDKQGNFSIGLSDQSVFPELTYEDTATPHGLQIIFNIKANNQEQARALLEKMGMPFERSR